MKIYLPYQVVGSHITNFVDDIEVVLVDAKTRQTSTGLLKLKSHCSWRDMFEPAGVYIASKMVVFSKARDVRALQRSLTSDAHAADVTSSDRAVNCQRVRKVGIQRLGMSSV
jgi:hypothetical protein